MPRSVAYLSYVVDAQGLHPDPDKVRAISDAPRPRSVSELKSYLGLLAYYSKVLPDLATLLPPPPPSMPSMTRHVLGAPSERKHFKHPVTDLSRSLSPLQSGPPSAVGLRCFLIQHRGCAIALVARWIGTSSCFCDKLPRPDGD